jgi:hypothetical protein
MALAILDAEKVADTVTCLRRRIEERFPESGLLKICEQMERISAKTQQRSAEISSPIWWIRLIGWVLIVLVGIIGFVLPFVVASGFTSEELTLRSFLELGDPVMNEIVLLGALIFFLFSLETRVKRHRALKAIHELRSIAHVIDMHQLTKDPERVVSAAYKSTSLSPKTSLDKFQLRRYLDYCSEMLSLTGKMAALYVQNFDDGVALSAVNEIESLTTGLSRKIWQKIMILYGMREHAEQRENQASKTGTSKDDLGGGSIPSV